MIRHRRRLLGVISASMAGLAGCQALLEDVTTHEAAPATVADEALSETGYTQVSSESLEVEREFAGQTVAVTNQVARFDRSVGLEGVVSASVATFAVITSPQVTVAGQDFNPLDDMANRDIAAMAQDHYENLSVGDSAGERSVSTLETTVALERFSATATSGGQEAELWLDVGTAEHSGDHVVFVGVYPATDGALAGYDPDQEASHISRLVAGTRHPA